MKRNWGIISVFAAMLMIGLYGCDDNYTPKPRGNFRLALPEKTYTEFDSAGFPYRFEYPSYAKIEFDNSAPGEEYWINVNFPEFKGGLHMTYKPVKDNLMQYLNDSYELANKHMQKATAIRDSLFINHDHHVYGISYEIEGVGTASPFQFILTDSTQNFVRGALYFNVKPNNDSLAPVIKFLEDDIFHLINSFEWTDKQAK